MRVNFASPVTLAFCATMAISAPTSASASAQQQEGPAQRQEPAALPQGDTADDNAIVVNGAPPADLSGLAKGPDVVGIISARSDDRLRVTGADETNTVVALSEGTDIRGRGGFLGLSRTAHGADALLNGLPVTVETVQWGEGLVASRVRLRNTDLQTATMIRTGTAQGFSEQTEATNALRSRVANIDEYTIMRTTNVYFDTARHQLSPQAEAELCATASQAQATDNALLLVVGYADAVGDEDFNQVLSERRAGRVVNYLQQRCRWAPYRMLTPSGMAETDPLADNMTAEGRAQNRRVSISVLVSKAVEGL